MKKEFSIKKIANKIVDECESTNDLAKQLLEFGYPSGTWVSARKQSKGRGRYGNHWISNEGNIFLSIIFWLEVAQKTKTPILTALAVVETLENIFKEIEIKIKWPNDFYSFDKKIGGILCESAEHYKNKLGQSGVICGIGININNAPDKKTIENEAISLRELVSKKNQDQLNIDRIRTELIKKLKEHFFSVTKDDLIVENFSNRQYFRKGDHLRWIENKIIHTGVYEGIGTRGEIIIFENKNNSKRQLFSGEVSVLRRI